MPNSTVSFRVIAAIVMGNALEWYDFMAYSFMTVFIATLFFPHADLTTSLLAATASLGVAFCVRPLGGVFFGVLADRKGRKVAITAVMAIMTIAILIIATAHTYAEVGIIAPIMIVIARMLQGFSAGGEFGPSSALLIELAPPSKRGLYGSWQTFGQMLAIFLGGAIGVVLTHCLSMQQLEAWGWRIPFFIGLIIAPIGVYIRHHLHEPMLAENAQLQRKKTSFLGTMKSHWQEIFLVMGLIFGGTAFSYVNISYLPLYASRYLHIEMSKAFIAVALSTLLMLVLIPFFGALSDKINRKALLIVTVFAALICIYPLYAWLISQPSLLRLISMECILGLLMAAYFGVFTVVAAELFPRAIRATGLSISNNLAVLTFGGFGQLIVTWLIKTTGSIFAPAYYLLAAMLISFITALFLPSKERTTNDNIGMALALSCD